MLGFNEKKTKQSNTQDNDSANNNNRGRKVENPNGAGWRRLFSTPGAPWMGGGGLHHSVPGGATSCHDPKGLNSVATLILQE